MVPCVNKGLVAKVVVVREEFTGQAGLKLLVSDSLHWIAFLAGGDWEF